MRIHNYYSDVLSRFYMFLNNSVLSPANKIKRIQYNLGSAASIIQYSDHYDLPSAIIKLGEIAPWSSVPTNPSIFQFRSRYGFNPYKMTAVSNQTKGIDLDLQTRYFSIQLEVAINCESQMQALNLSHDITIQLPVDRLLNQFEFVSFIELDDRYMIPTIMDIQNDEIFNLFLNHDSVDSKPSYSFSFLFSPLIRLTSTPQMNLDDSTKGSYQVTCSFEVNTQVPFHIISPELPNTDEYQDDKIMNTLTDTKVGTLTSNTVSLPVYSNFIYYWVMAPGLSELVSIPLSAIDTAINKMSYNGTLSDGRTYSILSDYVGDETEFNYSIIYKGTTLSGIGILFNYANSASVCRLGGDIIGNILNPTVTKINNDSSTISGIVLGNNDEFLIDNEQLIFNMAWSRTRPSLINSTMVPGWLLRQPATNDIYSVVSNVNAYRTSLSFTRTLIYGFVIYDPVSQVQTDVTLTTPYSLLPDGSFSVDIATPSAMTVSGVFNKSTAKLTSSVVSVSTYELLSISLKPMWDYLPYGSSQFDSISMDIAGVSNTAIPSQASHDAFIDKIATLNTSYVAIYSTLPYTQQLTQFIFSLTIDPKIANIDPTLINKQFEIYFIHDGRYFSSLRTGDFMLDLSKSIPTDLVFKTTENFRLNVLDKISKYLPLYFGIILL